MSARSQGDNWEQALQIFRQLVQVHGVQPNTVCVNAMMLALSRGRQWEEVMVVLDGIESVSPWRNGWLCILILSRG